MRIQKAFTDATVGTPALAVIGTWDPLIPAHRELFQEIARRGAEAELTPVVIILFPSPTRLLNPAPSICLEYTDIRARIVLIRECADVEVLIIRLTKSDLDASCRSFFHIIGSYLRLRELWLGADQSLGRGQQGSDAAIAALARSRKISLRRMPVIDGSRVGGMALRLLGEGKVREATQYVGHGPIWGRPKSGVLKLNWPPGKYLAVSIAKPAFTPVATSGLISVRISPPVKGRQPTLEWPRRDMEWLSFLASAADIPKHPVNPCGE
jgi:hypothetical protein